MDVISAVGRLENAYDIWSVSEHGCNASGAKSRAIFSGKAASVIIQAPFEIVGRLFLSICCVPLLFDSSVVEFTKKSFIAIAMLIKDFFLAIFSLFNPELLSNCSETSNNEVIETPPKQSQEKPKAIPPSSHSVRLKFAPIDTDAPKSAAPQSEEASSPVAPVMQHKLPGKSILKVRTAKKEELAQALAAQKPHVTFNFEKNEVLTFSSGSTLSS
jgi:hypothetical protein